MRSPSQCYAIRGGTPRHHKAAALKVCVIASIFFKIGQSLSVKDTATAEGIKNPPLHNEGSPSERGHSFKLAAPPDYVVMDTIPKSLLVRL